MGIAGHILGPKKLRAMSALTGLDLVRAYRRGGAGEGIVASEGGHLHYAFNPVTGEHRIVESPMHWASCSTIDWSTS